LIPWLILFAAASSAQQWPKYLLGPGVSSCGTWTADQRNDTNHDFYYVDEAWVLGFLSGIGVGDPNSNPLRGLDSNAVTAWIDNYCQAHPLVAIATAAEVFAHEHPN
jgi:hypothetical protein